MNSGDSLLLGRGSDRLVGPKLEVSVCSLGVVHGLVRLHIGAATLHAKHSGLRCVLHESSYRSLALTYTWQASFQCIKLICCKPWQPAALLCMRPS